MVLFFSIWLSKLELDIVMPRFVRVKYAAIKSNLGDKPDPVVL